MKQNIRIFYIGTDPFTGKILKALFSKKDLRISNAAIGTQLPVVTRPGDLILLDLPELIQKRTDIHQVLVSYQPVNNCYLKYWCKSPLNEENLENLLFFLDKNERLIEGAPDINLSTGKLDSFLGDDEESKKEVVAEFLENLSSNYRRLERAILTDDLKNTRHFAHKMLTGAGFYGAEELNEVLKQLEDESTEHSKESLIRALDFIYRQVVQLRSALVRSYF